MAKDILVNTQSGDLIVSDNLSQTTFWNVVWGKLFDSDEAEYMNIIVPSGYINNTQYTDNQYECAVHADYYPVNETFLVRLVVQNVATGKYNRIQDYSPNAPESMGATYYPTYTSRAEDINACQLPIVDIDGNFKVLFKKYSNSNFSRAIITSAKDVDFTIGNADSQSAQLLARCAPGKYYRYPTTGLDLTKYINSVVEHTDMASQLVKQFSSDSKQISEAEFDSNTGDLQIVFSGTSEADDKNLTAPDKLDIDLFRIADDDFIRAAYKEAQSVTDSNEEFVASFIATTSFMGIYDIGNAAELDKISPEITLGAIDTGGEIISSNINYVASMKLEAGKMYAICYPSSVIKIGVPTTQSPVWVFQHNPLFALYKDDSLVYVDEPFYSHAQLDWINYRNSFANRRCFIPLTDLTAIFYAGTSANYIGANGYGIYPIVDKTGNYNSILGLSTNSVTGKLTGMITNHSTIEDIKIDVKTNQILIIKQ